MNKEPPMNIDIPALPSYTGGSSKLVERIEIKKASPYRRAGHLTDQSLKFSYPKGEAPQLGIFDSLQDKTKELIKGDKIEVTELVEGIRLSNSETRVIDSLCKLLHEKSQTTDPSKQNYFSGNSDFGMVEYGKDKETPAPKLAFSLYELTTEYKGGGSISGKDVENVKQVLTELDKKRFLLSYIETTKTKDGGRIENKIEDFRTLIHILNLSQTEFDKDGKVISKKEDSLILLNPIFRRQIDTKFIQYPADITRRTVIAYGSGKVSEATLRLREYLMRELSSKRYDPEITLDRLYHLLADKWMKESRRKKVKEYTDKALETVKALGLLLSFETKPASSGEDKVIFHLDRDWK